METGRRAARDLPDDLALPLTSGAGWWYWLGGRPALDLVNTLRERWWRRVETLCDPDDLVGWMRLAGVLPGAGDVRATGRHLREARELREAVDGLLAAHLDGRPPVAADVAVLQTRLTAAAEAPRLAVHGGRLVLEEAPGGDPVTRGIGLVARDAARMLGTAERDRVRVCASDTCSARFYDRSPGGRRRWCSMTGCGNRAKVRRHRAAGRREGG